MMIDHIQQADVLTDLLSCREGRKIRGLDELTKLIHRAVPSSNTVGVRVRKGEKGSAKGKKRSSGKKKATHYLAVEVYENLGEVKETIKSFLPVGKKGKATKSKIVNTAIQVMLEEFQKGGENSFLVKQILESRQSSKS